MDILELRAQTSRLRYLVDNWSKGLKEWNDECKKIQEKIEYFTTVEMSYSPKKDEYPSRDK